MKDKELSTLEGIPFEALPLVDQMNLVSIESSFVGFCATAKSLILRLSNRLPQTDAPMMAHLVHDLLKITLEFAKFADDVALMVDERARLHRGEITEEGLAAEKEAAKEEFGQTIAEALRQHFSASPGGDPRSMTHI